MHSMRTQIWSKVSFRDLVFIFDVPSCFCLGCMLVDGLVWLGLGFDLRNHVFLFFAPFTKEFDESDKSL